MAAGPVRTNVTHFQSNVSKRIPLLPTFLQFFARVKQEFDSELGGQESAIYRLPTRVTDIKSRVKIDSQTAYDDLQTEISQIDTSSPMPAIYVWSIGKPISPTQKDLEDLMGSSATSGRSHTVSEMCKIGQEFTCMACKFVCDKFKRKCHASHILEVEECKDLSHEELKAVLGECQIIGVEDLSNHISLCDVCHNDYFDRQLLGIGIAEDRSSYMWIVKGDAMDRDTPVGGTYGEIVHNKPLQFKYAQQKPPLGLVEHRLKRFQEGKSSAASLKRKKFSQVWFFVCLRLLSYVKRILCVGGPCNNPLHW